MEFFAKFALTSNNELAPIYIEKGETRYWVRKIKVLEDDNTELLKEMTAELPAFMWFLLHRELSTTKSSRMWFDHRLLFTDALRKMINHSRNKVEMEMLQIVSGIMDIKKTEEYKFCVADMAHMLEMRGHRTEYNFIRRILQHNWSLKPSEPQYYIGERLSLDGSIFTTSATTGRCYTVTKEKLDEIMLVR